jgi:hypothetical protein
VTGKSRGPTGQAAGRPSAGQTALRDGGRIAARRLGLAGAVAVTARLVAAAGLGIDAFVHADIASTYAEGGGTISEAVLFRAEAVLASLTALALILAGRRLCLLVVFGVPASALAAMLVSRYVDPGAVGPFPHLYDPVWFAENCGPRSANLSPLLRLSSESSPAASATDTRAPSQHHRFISDYRSEQTAGQRVQLAHLLAPR